MLRIQKFNCCFCWYCSLVLALPVAFSKSFHPEDYTDLLRASSRQLVNGISSVELISERMLEYPLEGWSSSRTAKVRIEGNKVRADVTAEILTTGKDGKAREVVLKNWSSAYDGEATYTLPSNSSVFTIYPGNVVEEYALFFKGMYMNGIRLDKWLENMEITYSGRTEDKDEGLHKFTGLRQLAPARDGKPRSRRFEIVASEKLGFGIISCKIYDEAKNLLSEYNATKFAKIGEDIWVPTITVKKSYHAPKGQLSRKELTRTKYKTVNEPMDSAIFRLSPPPNYTIVDRVHDIVINPSELESQLLDLEDLEEELILNAPDKQSNTIDSPTPLTRPQLTSDQRPDTHNDKEAFQEKSEQPREDISLGTGKVWAYRGLTATALILTLVAGIMIGRRRLQARQ